MKRRYIIPLAKGIDVNMEAIIATSAIIEEKTIGLGEGYANENYDALSREQAPGIWNSNW